jgi:centromere protein I
VTLEEIESADSFVTNLEKIELPNQLAAVLADPLLQKLMLLKRDEESYGRALNWISSAILDIKNGDADSTYLSDVLGVIEDYLSVTKVSCPRHSAARPVC